MGRLSLVRWVQVVLWVLALAGCAVPPINPNALSASAAAAQEGKQGVVPAQVSYQLQVGDVLDVKLFYNPELNENAVIRPDGKISLQLLGEVAVAGMAPQELEQVLVKKYGTVVRKPEVAVIVRKFASQKIYVGGEVLTPGALPVEGRGLTALEAIMQSGGFKHSAERSNVFVLRNTGSAQPTFIKLDLEAQLSEGGQEDIALKPFDIVYVPQTQIAKTAQFFDEYIGKIIPLYRNLGLSLVYDFSPQKNTRLQGP